MSRTIVIGGVAGGMSAATRLRRLDEKAEILVIERSGHVSFANCGLPYHLGGVIADRESLLLQSPSSLGRRFGLDVRVRAEVTAIDLARRVVTVHDLESDSSYREPYDSLVLSPGAAPLRPAIPGAERMHVLRTMEDLDALIEAVGKDRAAPARAVVLGGGFIGLEVTENLLARGLEVVLVQRGAHLLPTLDPEMAAPLAGQLRAAGVTVLLGAEATAYTGDRILLDTGHEVRADLVVAAIGVTPDTGLAAEAGLALGPGGGIAVDEYHRASDPAVFAIGDAAEKTDGIAGERRLIALAGLANRHGRAVADTIAGRGRPARPAWATSIVEVVGQVAASVGTTETRLRASGVPLRVIHTHPTHHAGYYPGARSLSIKLIVHAEDDRILGAQIVGTEGVDKRIDVLATAMSAGIRASELADLELAYAPQFGSAKDPVNMLGYIAGNQAAGEDPTLQWHELDAALAAGVRFLDVRSAGQLEEGTIPGATHVPVEDLRAAAAGFGSEPIVVHCRVGQGAHTAQRLLVQLGFDVRNLDGGYLTWRAGQDARDGQRKELA